MFLFWLLAEEVAVVATTMAVCEAQAVAEAEAGEPSMLLFHQATLIHQLSVLVALGGLL